MSDEAPVTFFKKKGKGRPAALRKRSLSPSSASPGAPSQDEPQPSAVIQATRKTAANHLIQGTGGFKRRKAAQEDADSALLSSEEEDAESSSAAALKAAQSFIVNHSSTYQRPRRRSSSPPADVMIHKEREAAGEDDGLYRGAAKQLNNVQKSFGPIKGGPSNVRTITLVDYQPDVCKDYKETGFCGFGDTCKFLHDRGDYLHGWQLDNSFLSSQAAAGSFMAKQNKRNSEGGQTADDSDSEDEDLPFACLICRKPFGKDPVVTLCGHYFDAGCAVKRFAKTGKCFACGKGTNGVFNKATKLIAKQKEREAIQKAAEAEERDFEENDEDQVEIEGLEVEQPAAGGFAGSDEEEEDEEEEQKPAKRRPIIEIH